MQTLWEYPILKENSQDFKSATIETDQATPVWLIGSLTTNLRVNAGDITTSVTSRHDKFCLVLLGAWRLVSFFASQGSCPVWTLIVQVNEWLLYDAKDRKHINTAIIHKAWEDIGKEFGFKGSYCSEIWGTPVSVCTARHPENLNLPSGAAEPQISYGKQLQTFPRSLLPQYSGSSSLRRALVLEHK